jgi:hypothetical protein
MKTKVKFKIHCYNQDSRAYCGRFKSAIFHEIPYVFDRLLPEHKCKQCEKKKENWDGS